MQSVVKSKSLTLKRAEMLRLTDYHEYFLNRPRLQYERSKAGVWLLCNRQKEANTLPLPALQSKCDSDKHSGKAVATARERHAWNPRMCQASCHYPATQHNKYGNQCWHLASGNWRYWCQKRDLCPFRTPICHYQLKVKAPPVTRHVCKCPARYFILLLPSHISQVNECLTTSRFRDEPCQSTSPVLTSRMLASETN